jgi:hypothetical protein
MKIISELSQVKNETPTFAESLIGWCCSIGFLIGIATSIYVRVEDGNADPSFRRMGILFLCLGLAFTFRDIFFPGFMGYSQSLRRQSIYSNIWMTLAGGWLLFARCVGDIGLVLLTATGLLLWALSHREVLTRRRRRLTDGEAPASA